MGELKYAILGLLNQRDLTGYDIRKEFKENISSFWDAKHSQIYPELKNLLNEKKVEYEIVIQGEKLEKKLYHITKLGQDELLEWLKTDGEPISIPKETFRL
ncbi:MAG: PadR family transcriptional regulator, partial [Spirochaetales bacterium]|nr:PadR family transcriptional regulator [Spirochaetales bacterium]